MSVTFVVADTRDALAAMPDGSVDLILTSPPFLALRSYLPPDHPDKGREIGSEATPAEFVDTLLGLSAEWRRVLAPHGTLAVELGDTYSGSGGAGGDYGPGGLRDGQERFDGSASKAYCTGGRPRPARDRTRNPDAAWPMAKSLSLVPEAYRLGLAYGLNPLTGAESPAGRWRVRNVVDWCRPNPPVGALGDKFRPSTSDLVIACVASDRWFDLDAVRQPIAASTAERGEGSPRGNGKHMDEGTTNGAHGRHFTEQRSNPAGAPPLDHWVIPPGGYKGSHYATWPTDLLRVPVEAMCPRRVCRTCGEPSRRVVDADRRPVEGRSVDRFRGSEAPAPRPGGAGFSNEGHTTYTTTGWTSCGCPGTDGVRLDGWHTGTGWRPGRVLDPFGGSGTTGLVASGLSRDALLFDLDERNLHLARERVGMFLDEAKVDDLSAGRLFGNEPT